MFNYEVVPFTKDHCLVRVQGGPLLVINGVIIPLNGLLNLYLELVITPTNGNISPTYN